MYRHGERGVEVLLAHPGGPFWAKKDAGAWTIPKGLVDSGEDKLAAARREFREETSFEALEPFVELGTVQTRSKKTIHAFACAGDVDASKAVSNTFEMEWPRGSGRKQSFPEIDRCAWLPVDEARVKINDRQVALLDRLLALVACVIGP